MTGFEIIEKAYTILELPDMATRDDIRTAYRDLCRRYHPDKCTGKEKSSCSAMFRRITWARDILLNYLDSYRYIFTEEEYKNHLGPEALNHLNRFYSVYGEFLSDPAQKSFEDTDISSLDSPR